MRVTLVHNPEAGSGDHLGSELLARLRDEGHEPVYTTTEAASLSRALDDAPDVVLAAGGDGTVGAVARLMAARTPSPLLAILPVGTANNLARSLGVHGTVDDVVRGLDSNMRRRLDVATVRAPWGTVRFVESAGVGLFGAMLRDAERDSNADGSSAGRQPPSSRGARLLRILDQSRARHWRIEADGEDVSGTYLLAAAMNTRFVGPTLDLAPDADAGDGRLELLLIREEDREALRDYLVNIDDENKPRVALPTRRVKRARLEWNATSGHVDDHLWPERSPQSRPIDVGSSTEVDALGSHLEILVPSA
jgi:diacylglycerol kinase family enzyme